MSKKRKRNIVEELNGSIEHVALKVFVPNSLPCEICGKSVFNYRLLQDITCSYDCFTVLQLSKQNKMLHEHNDVCFEQ